MICNHFVRATVAATAAIVLISSAKAEEFVLVIGINDYAVPLDARGLPLKDAAGNPVSNELHGAVNDAKNFELLLRSKLPTLRSSNVRVLLDRSANEESFRQSVSFILQNIRSGDRMWLFFSGHGATIPDRTSATGSSSVIALSDQILVKGSFFHEFADALRLKGVSASLVFDCCFGGGMLKSLRGEIKTATPKSLSNQGKVGPRLDARARLITALPRLQKLDPTRTPKTLPAKSSLTFIFSSDAQSPSFDLVYKNPTRQAEGAFSGIFTECFRANLNLDQAMTQVTSRIREAGIAQRPGFEVFPPSRKSAGLFDAQN